VIKWNEWWPILIASKLDLQISLDFMFY